MTKKLKYKTTAFFGRCGIKLQNKRIGTLQKKKTTTTTKTIRKRSTNEKTSAASG